MTSDPAPFPIRTGLKRAVAWHALASICRQNPGLGLRIVETHPGGGQYDCLSLALMPDCATLCSFNLGGTSLLLGQPVGRRRPGRTWGDDPDATVWRYNQHGLGRDRDELARDIEAWLGFPERQQATPKRTPSTLAHAVIGELLDRVALGTKRVELRSGWQDSSGMEGSRERTWTQRLPALVGIEPGVEWQARCEAASRYWSLTRGAAHRDPAVVVDSLTTEAWVRGAPRASLLERYKRGDGVRAMAWVLEQSLDVGA